MKRTCIFFPSKKERLPRSPWKRLIVFVGRARGGSWTGWHETCISKHDAGVSACKAGSTRRKMKVSNQLNAGDLILDLILHLHHHNQDIIFHLFSISRCLTSLPDTCWRVRSLTRSLAYNGRLIFHLAKIVRGLGGQTLNHGQPGFRLCLAIVDHCQARNHPRGVWVNPLPPPRPIPFHTYDYPFIPQRHLDCTLISSGWAILNPYSTTSSWIANCTRTQDWYCTLLV
jgi:hypothetical protein